MSFKFNFTYDKEFDASKEWYSWIPIHSTDDAEG